jgi:hypothetical protein
MYKYVGYWTLYAIIQLLGCHCTIVVSRKIGNCRARKKIGDAISILIIAIEVSRYQYKILLASLIGALVYGLNGRYIVLLAFSPFLFNVIIARLALKDD